MNSSRTITLFWEPPASSRSPSSVLVSLLLHGVAFGLLYLGLKHTPRIDDQSLAQRYTVRLLNLHRTEPRVQWSAAKSVAHPATQAAASAAASGGRPEPPAAPLQLAQAIPAPQTLVQPDLPPNLLLPQETPIPLVLMWSPENSPVRQIVPPPPQKPAVADVQPSPAPPNRESHLADLKITASVLVAVTPSLPPSTTSPLVVRAPAAVKQVPETTSKAVAQPTPARVMSLSDLQLEQGTIALPLVNETSAASSSDRLVPGRPQNSPAGNGNPASKQTGMGAGQNADNQGDKAGNQTGNQNGAVAGAGPGSGTPGSGVTSGLNAQPLVTTIRLPENGHFGVVVVGSSLAEEYPETLGIWNGRLAYTVYLHVGLAKSWILQYSLPRAAMTGAAGNVVRPDAPWPYLIVRPHLAPGDSDADAIMVHGMVNTGGHFENLAVVFPPQFAQAKFVLNALQQWQFRPAVESGRLTAVEVLLIIPDPSDDQPE